MLQLQIFANASHIQKTKINIGNDQINYVSNPGGKSTWELPRWQVGTVVKLLKFATGSLQASELTGTICWVAPAWHMNASRLQFSRIAESHTAESLFPLAVLRHIHRDYLLTQNASYLHRICKEFQLVMSAKWRTIRNVKHLLLKIACETK